MKRFLWLVLCLIILCPGVSRAEGLNLESFGRLPVLHEGRIKPLDALARVELQRIYGAEKFHGLPAIEFLAMAMFEPGLIAAAPVIPVRDTQVRQHMGVAERAERYFSLNDLRDGLQETAALLPPLMAKEAIPTESQKALLAVHEHAITLMQIMGTLDNQDRNINQLMRILPPADGTEEDWASPWQHTQARGNPALLAPWQAMAQAWSAQDQAQWDRAVDSAHAQTAAHVDETRIRLETFYRAVQPLQWAERLYFMAFLLMIGAAALTTRPILAQAGFMLAAAGALAQVAAIGMRIVILDRPPVATLYETLIFVSAIVIFSALVIECVKRSRLPLIAGLGAGLVLLLAAPAFAPMGDSMEMLVAVLNTGFWLSTHVICITIGYGVSVLAATLAHFALVQPAARLEPMIHKTLIVALFFTAFGTMLGGVWADQSWGRFWGWDPKENGALLIVLWIAWVLHGRWAGVLKGVWMNAATAMLAMIVALAWFGVNLLNIGLHSYGFTDSMAAGLIAFCAIEIAFITIALWCGRTA